MYVVDTACLLANAFFVKKEMDSIPLSELRDAFRGVSASIAKFNAVISWTRSELDATLYIYQDIFRRTGTSISRVSGVDLFSSYVDIVFNAGLKPEIVEEIQSTLRRKLER